MNTAPPYLVVICAALHLCSFPAFADTPRATHDSRQWGKPSSGMSCLVRTNKVEYEIGEDILLDVFVRNEDHDNITVIRPEILTSYVAPMQPVTIIGPQGACKFQGSIHSRPLPMPKTNYISLRPGEVIGVSAHAQRPPRIDPEDWGLTTPGDYTIEYTFARTHNWYWDTEKKTQLPYKAWTGHATANPVTIRIRRTTPSDK
jgi:hypothetical protein